MLGTEGFGLANYELVKQKIANARLLLVGIRDIVTRFVLCRSCYAAGTGTLSFRNRVNVIHPAWLMLRLLKSSEFNSDGLDFHWG